VNRVVDQLVPVGLQREAGPERLTLPFPENFLLPCRRTVRALVDQSGEEARFDREHEQILGWMFEDALTNDVGEEHRAQARDADV